MSRWLLALLGTFVAAALPSAALAQASSSAFTSGIRYDAERRVVGTIAPDPDGNGPLTFAAVRNSYDAAGRLVLVETGELAGWQDERVAPSQWSGFTVLRQVATSYDAAERKIADVVSSGGVTYSVTQYSYDLLDRLVCTAVRMDPAQWGGQTDACVPQTNGPNGPDRITRTLYDGAGRVGQMRRAVGTSLEQAYVTYAYTPNGKQSDVIDANGNHAQMTYDGFDREQRWYFPSPSAPSGYNPSDQASAQSGAGQANTNDYEEYGYDANGNRTSWRKRDGRVFTFNFDALNRVTAKLVPTACVGGYACSPVPAWATRSVYYDYDLMGHQTGAYFDSLGGGDQVTSGYDGLGRLKSSTTVMNGVSRKLTYRYDADGNRTDIVHPSGGAWSFSYDGLDRFLALTDGNGTWLAGAGYDSAGRRAWLSRVDGTNTGYNYDPASRLQYLVQDHSRHEGDSLTDGFSYNPAGQIVSRSRSNGSYAFTSAVNVSRGYQVNGLNQYTAAGPASFGYDANGSLTGDGTTNYAYDAENRLVTSSTGPTQTALTYDPLGRLWRVSGTAGETQFLYDGDRLTAEYDGSGTLLRSYVHGPGEDEPLVWYEGAGFDDRRTLQADHQGSIISVTDASGNLKAIDAYDEYGIPNRSNIGRFQYTGQAWIPELGMYHYKARLYSPTLGRFLQTDPVGYKDQINLYAYVGNDPVNGSDPTGMAGCGGEDEPPCPPDHTVRDRLATAGAIAGAIVGGDAGAAAGGAAGGAAGAAACGPGAVVCSPAGAVAGGTAGAAAGGTLGAAGGAVVGGSVGGLIGNLIDKGIAMMSAGDGTTPHGEQRQDEARAGDNSRQVGDPNRVVREGRQLTDSETGAKVYVNGNRVVVVGQDGRVTQFTNTRANTNMRIQSGRWVP